MEPFANIAALARSKTYPVLIKEAAEAYEREGVKRFLSLSKQ
jgi:hypothetical protein